MTQHAIILSYLQDVNDWVKEGFLTSKETPYGFIGFAGSRRVRELVEKGLLERRKVGKYAEVRFKKHELSKNEMIMSL